jgi:hypothetical protein
MRALLYLCVLLAFVFIIGTFTFVLWPLPTPRPTGPAHHDISVKKGTDSLIYHISGRAAADSNRYFLAGYIYQEKREAGFHAGWITLWRTADYPTEKEIVESVQSFNKTKGTVTVVSLTEFPSKADYSRYSSQTK